MLFTYFICNIASGGHVTGLVNGIPSPNNHEYSYCNKNMKTNKNNVYHIF